jgi:hypothetical protein
MDLEERARIQSPAISESSGLVKSVEWPGVFWTHNDSGDTPRIFAIKGDGNNVRIGPPGDEGILVRGAENVDWEDITRDDRGHLIIGDIGNNLAHRPTVTLYRVKEPDPVRDHETDPAEKTLAYFPDRHTRAFNSEALFWARGRIYLLTKTHGGINTGLYRLDTTDDPGNKARLTRVGAFDFGAPVTAADISPDGRWLAVLTYGAIWLFEGPQGTDNYLGGKRSSFHFDIRQCEAICFDGNKLLISNEDGRLFQLDVESLFPLQ